MKILVLLSRVPYPLEKGDKLRAFNQIKHLSEKHEITLFAINDGPLHKEALRVLNKYCSEIKIVNLSGIQVFWNLFKSLFSGIPFQIGYFYFNKMQKEIDSYINKNKPDHIYCQLIRTTEYVKKYSNIPKTLDYMDVFSKGMERRKNTTPFYLRPIYMLEHKRLLKYEKSIFDYFENKTIISRQDRDLIPHPKRHEIAVIPNGVDLTYFHPIEKEKEFELLFNGNMSYPPNIESAVFLVNEILPIVHKINPKVRLLISGAAPSEKVKALASKSVVVSGWVDDIRVSFARSKILIAPMQISIGLQNKLLEAMAMQIPCITSTMANNALGAEHDKNILVAETAEEYARHIIYLLDNSERSVDIALQGFNFVNTNYSWKSTGDLLEGIIS